jgi:hypothetical protein
MVAMARRMTHRNLREPLSPSGFDGLPPVEEEGDDEDGRRYSVEDDG